MLDVVVAATIAALCKTFSLFLIASLTAADTLRGVEVFVIREESLCVVEGRVEIGIVGGDC